MNLLSFVKVISSLEKMNDMKCKKSKSQNALKKKKPQIITKKLVVIHPGE